MDSVFSVVRFRISPTDFKALIDHLNFLPINEEEEFKRLDQKSSTDVRITKSEFLIEWQRRILNMSKVDVSFGSDWKVFSSHEKGVKKYIFVNPAESEVIFVLNVN